MGFTVSWVQMLVSRETLKAWYHATAHLMSEGTLILEEDGSVSMIDPDDSGETFWVLHKDHPHHNHHYTNCKTNRRAYTYDVMRALIMAYEFGIVSDMDNDDPSDFPWFQELRKVHRIRPLKTYAEQLGLLVGGDAERDELRAENERLRAAMTEARRHLETLQAALADAGNGLARSLSV